MLLAVRTFGTGGEVEAGTVPISHVQTGLRQRRATGFALASWSTGYDLQTVGALSIARGWSTGQGGRFGGAAVRKRPHTLVKGLEQARQVFLD